MHPLGPGARECHHAALLRRQLPGAAPVLPLLTELASSVLVVIMPMSDAVVGTKLVCKEDNGVGVRLSDCSLLVPPRLES